MKPPAQRFQRRRLVRKRGGERDELIVNPKLARSQLYGGMIWGISFAPHGSSGQCRSCRLSHPGPCRHPGHGGAADRRGRPYVNGLGIKGVDKIGITGTVGAIANAIWHATGVRAHRFPIRIEDLMS
ncbi:hypothetical protein [Oricola nitratireducens]|uniref:hypothetical protein n=1 Tax=Oricola nitratireducens TaxID=2775868 RepID=UPI003D17900C